MPARSRRPSGRAGRPFPIGKARRHRGSAWLGQRLVGRGPRLPFADLLAVGALGGIGFTVSLLLAALAFGDDPFVRDQAILGVLAGSAVSLVLAAVLVSWRARHYRTREAVAMRDGVEEGG